MPIALESFMKQLADSGVIAPGKLEGFVPPKAHPKDAQELARQLVESKQLTKYQAQEIYQGRGRSLILGNYTILDKIGAGGMGQVFKAQHRRMDRVVAIKMLPRKLTKDAAAVARFEREVRAAARLSHSNIVAAHDADEADGNHFLVMEYVDGSDLSALVKKNGPFPAEKAVNYILQAARGLEFAHGEGVIHRDIKPANLLLDKRGTVKILDMGLARLETSGDAATEAELTGTGAVMGTVDYMAPEQALSTKHADARADIYSLGCSLFYLLTGKAVYDGDTLMAKLLAHREQTIPSLGSGVPEALQAVFERMVAKRVEDRFQTMAEVVAALEACRAGHSTSISQQQPAGESSSDVMTFLRTVTLNTPAKRAPLKNAVPTRTGGRKKALLLGAMGAGLLATLILAAVAFQRRTQEGPLAVKADQPPEPSLAEGVARPAAADFALDFDADKSYVATPVRYDGSFPLTVEAYVTQRQPAGSQYIIGDSENGGIHLVVRNGRFDMGYRAQSQTSAWGKTFAVPSRAVALPDRLYHVAGVIDHDSVRLFVDGVLQGTVSGQPLKPSILPLAIGTNPGGPLPDPPFFMTASETFDGMIDEVRISRVARYAGNFTPVRSFRPDADTLALYHFDEGTGAVAHDASGQGNHATIVRVKWVPAPALGVRPAAPLSSGGAGPAASSAERAGDEAAKWDTPELRKWIQAVHALPPDQQVEAVAAKLVELNPGFDGKLTGPGYKHTGTPRIESGNVTELGLVSDNLLDISALRALTNLKIFRCDGAGCGKIARFSDLSPLRGMRLVSLICYHTEVADLSPLQGMPLTNLNCAKTKVANLSPLTGMPLQSLAFNDTPVADLSPLAGMKLTEIYLTPGNVRQGMDVIRRMTTLKTIGTGASTQYEPAEFWRRYDAGEFGAPSSPLSPGGRGAGVEGAKWNTPELRKWIQDTQALRADQQVDAVRKRLQELNPGFDGKMTALDYKSPPRIQGGVVTEVVMVTPHVRDVTPLRVLTGLKSFRIASGVNTAGKFSDLWQLAGLPLVDLQCVGVHVTELAPLRGMQLTSVDCAYNGVTSLAPLGGMPLTSLKIGHTKVADLSPLAGMSLRHLSCDNTPVADLAVLRGMPLKELYCQSTPVADLSPLAGMELKTLAFTPANITQGLDVIRRMKSLQSLGPDWQSAHQFPPAEFWKKYDAGEFGKPGLK